MIVEDLGAQAVVSDSGAVIASKDRFTLTYARAGRTIGVGIEPLDTYYIRLPEPAVWSDGAPLSPPEAQQLVDDLADACAHWGIRCEFVFPDDPRILRSLDDLVAAIRSQRGEQS